MEERQDCSLFIASNDSHLPLPQDMLRHLTGLLAKAEDAKQILNKRTYVVVSCRDPKAAREARKIIMAEALRSGQRLTSDFIPTTAAGKNGRGKACSITHLLGCITRVLGVSRKALVQEEFATFVDLDMTLHIGAEDLLPHFHRILLSLDTTPATYMGQDSASMLEAESLAHFSVLQELEANGASNAELDKMRGVLHNEVHAAMPWLADVLLEQFEELVSTSSDDDHLSPRAR